MNPKNLVEVAKRVIIKIIDDLQWADIDSLIEITKLRGSVLLEANRELTRWCFLHESTSCEWAMGYRDIAFNHIEKNPLNDEDAKIEAEIMARWEAVKDEKMAFVP